MSNERIIIPQRVVNGGLDFKFDPDPGSYLSPYKTTNLKNYLSEEEYFDWITRLNASLKPFRAKKADWAALVLAPIPFVLPLWGLRRKKVAKKRKESMFEIINQFNATFHPTLFMKWNRKPISQLTIEIVTQTQKSNEEPPVSIAPYADPGGEPVSKYGEEYHRIGGPTNQQNETSSKINPANASFDLLDDFSSNPVRM